MMKKIMIFTMMGVLLIGCGQAQETPVVDISTPDISSDSTPVDHEDRVEQIEVPISELPRDASDVVSSSGNCARCHTGIFNDEGEDLSFDALWRATMMAQAARDPYWLATVSSEVIQEPELAAVIEDKCATCHMPLATFDAHLYGRETMIFGETGFLSEENTLHNLAMDGVSCNLCHQIEPDNFGQPDSFSGGYLLNTTEREWGGRVAYGPFEVSEPSEQMMIQFSGYRPVQSEHIQEAALCGTCHNLSTPYLDANGEIAGTFPEQMTYAEWEESSVGAAGVSCQICHMPKEDGPLPISAIVSVEKEYLRKHTFTGANAYMLNMLAMNIDELGITASDEHLQLAIEQVVEQLQNDAGDVSILDVARTAEGVTFEAKVTNIAGHKFPTGYPSRRLWLHVVIKDDAGNVVFESGAVVANGKILDNDNDLDASLYEPHYELITDPGQVQIYETIMQDTEGAVTTTLLRGSAYLKDNRLLPSGMPLTIANPDIAAYGLVLTDADFGDGTDLITYQIDLADVEGPLTIEIELLYQTIAYRWAENLQDVQTDEIELFGQMYDALENWPIVIAQDEALTD